MYILCPIFQLAAKQNGLRELSTSTKIFCLVTYLLGPFYSYQQNGMDYGSLAHQLKDYFQLCTFCVPFFNQQQNGMDYAVQHINQKIIFSYVHFVLFFNQQQNRMDYASLAHQLRLFLVMYILCPIFQFAAKWNGIREFSTSTKIIFSYVHSVSYFSIRSKMEWITQVQHIN